MEQPDDKVIYENIKVNYSRKIIVLSDSYNGEFRRVIKFSKRTGKYYIIYMYYLINYNKIDVENLINDDVLKLDINNYMDTFLIIGYPIKAIGDHHDNHLYNGKSIKKDIIFGVSSLAIKLFNVYNNIKLTYEEFTTGVYKEI